MSDPIVNAVEQAVQSEVAEVITEAAKEAAAETTAEVLEEVKEAVKETVNIEATLESINNSILQIFETLGRIESKVFEVKDIAEATLTLEVAEAVQEANEEENETETENETPDTIEVVTDSPIEAEVFETVKADEPSVKRGAKVRMI